ncbi:DegT/DnrJ/EryC1/StrS family aminotransferase [Streptomyces hygroscopicus]|uniref:DegT/DnrJ/EryC1/StrS family aminotransferase n=1 Tax=Streptomyces hygroscopicus TaxID=1912 RepID=UPI003F1C8E0B
MVQVRRPGSTPAPTGGSCAPHWPRRCAPATAIYEKPLDAQPVFESQLLPGRHPVAEDLCARHICLPLHTRMTKEDIGLVLSALPDALKAATG